MTESGEQFKPRRPVRSPRTMPSNPARTLASDDELCHNVLVRWKDNRAVCSTYRDSTLAALETASVALGTAPTSLKWRGDRKKRESEQGSSGKLHVGDFVVVEQAVRLRFERGTLCLLCRLLTKLPLIILYHLSAYFLQYQHSRHVLPPDERSREHTIPSADRFVYQALHSQRPLSAMGGTKLQRICRDVIQTVGRAPATSN